MTTIEPKVLKGFRDFLPAQEMRRRRLTGSIEAVFRSFGFVPIDTPALEYSEVLFGKRDESAGSETEKQGYRFTDSGGRDVALRYDLTVPFARYLAAHEAELPLPFKRYHIAKVWRGENTQRGRYREFTQCDFDIAGSAGAGADFEILLLMPAILAAAGTGELTIRVNHRGLFNRFLERLDAREQSVEILRAVDKLQKTGAAAVEEALAQMLDGKRAGAILDYVNAKDSWDDTLAAMTEAAGGPCAESERLAVLRGCMADNGVAGSFALDPSIARGLDYYTGVVFETFLNKLPSIGSVCSGGRYDNLAGLYGRANVTGVGGSVGLDRLMSALDEIDGGAEAASYADAAIACVSEASAGRDQALAMALRERGISVEVNLEAKKLSSQYMAAERKGIPRMIIPSDDGFTLRDLTTRQNTDGLSLDALTQALADA
jgi:histidyl-tRNA synthetase